METVLLETEVPLDPPPLLLTGHAWLEMAIKKTCTTEPGILSGEYSNRNMEKKMELLSVD